MAIYHLTSKPFERSKGRSATGGAAYRAGIKITCQRTGEIFDYSRKRANVLSSRVLFPDGGTEDQAEFWNRVELHHKRGDAVVAREIEFALPVELGERQRQEVAERFAQEIADMYAVGIQISLHKPHRISKKDQEDHPGQKHNKNWHAHALLTGCYCDQDGKLGKKCVELDPIHCARQKPKLKNAVEHLRSRWSDVCNAALEAAGSDARIDHRTLEEQNITRAPTEHLGPSAIGYERRTGRKSNRRIFFEDATKEQKEVEARAAAGVKSRSQNERRGEEESNWRPDRLDDDLDHVEHHEPAPAAEPEGHIEHVAGSVIDIEIRYEIRTWIQNLVTATKTPEGTLYIWENKHPACLDRGSRIDLCENVTEARTDLMLDLIRSKGWKSVRLDGTPEFREMMAAKLHAAGISITNPELSKPKVALSSEAERAYDAMKRKLNLDSAVRAKRPRSTPTYKPVEQTPLAAEKQDLIDLLREHNVTTMTADGILTLPSDARDAIFAAAKRLLTEQEMAAKAKATAGKRARQQPQSEPEKPEFRPPEPTPETRPPAPDHASTSTSKRPRWR